jgi:uncharacterized protein YjbI with pentapeptide repeats
MNAGTTPDFSAMDFAGTRLPGVDLVGVNLVGAQLQHTDLSGADLRGANLSRSDLTGADLCGATLSNAILVSTRLDNAKLIKADLNGADLNGASLQGSVLCSASLIGATLSETDIRLAELYRAVLSDASLQAADLTGADLRECIMVGTNVEGAILSECAVYGIAAWNLKGTPAAQFDLRITSGDEPIITVDNLEVAQFMHLLLNNRKIRDVIDTITSSLVLILGRFTPDRKHVLDFLRDELRRRGYLPVLFDFEKPSSRDLTETVSTLAHMSRFIIADITEARSIPQELERIVPSLPSVPVQPILQSLESEYGMFEHYTRYPWVLKVQVYDDLSDLGRNLHDNILSELEDRATSASSSGSRGIGSSTAGPKLA